jgi:hypothetical protein
MQDVVGQILLWCTLPGAAGGLAGFLYALRRGHYRNNRYVPKLLIELLGATVTASAISLVVSPSDKLVLVAFCIGVGWANLIQLVRKKITRLVEAALGESLGDR